MAARTNATLGKQLAKTLVCISDSLASLAKQPEPTLARLFLRQEVPLNTHLTNRTVSTCPQHMIAHCQTRTALSHSCCQAAYLLRPQLERLHSNVTWTLVED